MPSDISDVKNEPRERPLSPHLMSYRFPLTVLLSISHRATGVALTAGTLMIVWWLVAAAYGEEAFNQARDFGESPIGLFMIFGWSVALFYHLSNGIRHLFWDVGYLFKKETARSTSFLVILSTILLTAGAWTLACTKTNQSSAPAVSDNLVQVDVEEGTL